MQDDAISGHQDRLRAPSNDMDDFTTDLDVIIKELMYKGGDNIPTIHIDYPKFAEE